jgi:hypothetical protein
MADMVEQESVEEGKRVEIDGKFKQDGPQLWD